LEPFGTNFLAPVLRKFCHPNPILVPLGIGIPPFGFVQMKCTNANILHFPSRKDPFHGKLVGFAPKLDPGKTSNKDEFKLFNE
jgi:hypothetical protein